MRRRRTLFAAVVPGRSWVSVGVCATLSGLACSESGAGDEADSGSGIDGGSSSTSALSATSTTSAGGETGSADGTSTTDPSSTTVGDSSTGVEYVECPEPENALVQAGGGLGGVLGWPELGLVDTVCDAGVAFVDEIEGYVGLPLECLDSTMTGTVSLEVRLETLIDNGYLDALSGTEGLRLSQCISCGAPIPQVTLRDARGELVLLAYQTRELASEYDGDPERIVGRADWLEGMPEWEDWNAPFGEMWLRDVGCAPLEAAVRPLAIEFDADAGQVSLFNQNAAYGVEVGGRRFDLFAGIAIVNDEPQMKGLPAAQALFLILRSLDG